MAKMDWLAGSCCWGGSDAFWIRAICVRRTGHGRYQLEVDVMPVPVNPAQFRPLPGEAAGTVFDGYWRVEQIAPDTWAIGEPANDPDNYAYLLVGKRRAILIDSGATRDPDMSRVVAGLTALPVTVVPSHLHHDHTNGPGFFRNVALIDLPDTRAMLTGTMFGSAAINLVASPRSRSR